MKITRNNLDLAVAQGILSPEQARQLIDFLNSQPSTGPRFDITHVLYYMGGLIAIGASSLLLVMLIAGQIRWALRLPLVGLLLGAASYLVQSSAVLDPPLALRPLVDLVSLLTPFWTWLFARTLFEREPVRQVLLPLAAFLMLCWSSAHFLPGLQPAGFYGIHLVSLALVADIFRVAWLERADDLIEKRRMIRLWFPRLAER